MYVRMYECMYVRLSVFTSVRMSVCEPNVILSSLPLVGGNLKYLVIVLASKWSTKCPKMAYKFSNVKVTNMVNKLFQMFK